jgi:dolichyl-phosphate beta-glucosyltransferase
MPVAFSLIIPAYNESLRLPPFLATVRPYLHEQFSESHEVIVVDDGSQDCTSTVVVGLAADWPQLRVIGHGGNRGKGAAIRTGMLAGGGEVLLFADADGATPIAEERRLRAALESGADVAAGSRLVRAADVTRRRKLSRALTGQAFAGLVRLLLRPPVRDTQCGFKMFRREAALRLFAASQETGYLLDLEILVLARRLGYRVAEVPVNWSEVPGSKLSMARDWRAILTDLWRLRRRCLTIRGSGG